MTDKQIQLNLRGLNFYTGAIDGIMGSATQRGLAAFSAQYPGDQISKLSEVVRSIQTAVSGYSSGEMEIDGIYGDQTRQAVRGYQKAVGLTADGIAGMLTRKTIDGYDPVDAPADPDDFWASVKHFDRREFRCPCPRCGGFPVEPDHNLVRIADQLREDMGAVVTISSGVRCQAHNDELSGSVPNSRHVRGKAMDFSVRGKSGSQVNAYCQRMVSQGKLRYSYIISGAWVHMDVL